MCLYLQQASVFAVLLDRDSWGNEYCFASTSLCRLWLLVSLDRTSFSLELTAPGECVCGGQMQSSALAMLGLSCEQDIEPDSQDLGRRAGLEM